MKKSIRIAAWLLIAVLALVVITDGMMALGFSRAIQYLYNAVFFIAALPALVCVGLGDRLFYID